MGIINIFVHDYKHYDIYSSITLKSIHQLPLKKFKVEIKYNLNDYTVKSEAVRLNEPLLTQEQSPYFTVPFQRLTVARKGRDVCQASLNMKQ